jgi:hypothetical protein
MEEASESEGAEAGEDGSRRVPLTQGEGESKERKWGGKAASGEVRVNE